MRPGRMSRSGFLHESESLRDVIERDSATLLRAGITHEQIADRLECIVGRAMRIVELAYRSRGENDPPQPEDLWQKGVQAGPFSLKRDSWEGSQDCPFVTAEGDACEYSTYAYCDFVVTNTRSGLPLPFPGLAIHLIRDHHFFEGNVPHRVHPELACAVLHLEPGVDYSPKWATEWVWVTQWGTTESLEKWRQSVHNRHLVRALDESDAVVPVGDRGHLYFRGDLCVAVSDGESWIRRDLEVCGATFRDRHLWSPVSGFRRMEWRYVALEETL